MAKTGNNNMNIVDDANRKWTFLLLLVLTAVSLLLPLITSPAVCHTPAHFVSPHVAFAHAECAYAGQHLGIRDRGESSEPENTIISQAPLSMMLWAPCVFAIMAFAIPIPHFLWRQFRTWFGINIDNIVSDIHGRRGMPENERVELMKEVVRTLSLLLKNGEKSASLLLILVQKILTTLLSLVLFSTVQILADPFNSTHTSGPLRSHSNCTYTLSNEAGNMFKYSLNCIYPANLVLQKLFIFLAVYTVCLFLANLFDLVLWATVLFIPEVRDRKLAHYIHSAGEVTSASATSKPPRYILDRKFASFLGFDGYLLLQTVNQRLGEQAWAELSILLWRRYQDTIESEAYYDEDTEKGLDNPFDHRDSNDFVSEKEASTGERTDNIELNMLANQKRPSEAEDLNFIKPTEQI